MNRLVPEPLELRRLEEVVRDLGAGTESLPRGISHHPDVLRRYLYDRVFQGDWDGQIIGPNGSNMTKHAGKFISIKALREQVLKDIEDLIAFMTAPVGESTRSAIYHRTPEAKTGTGAQLFSNDPFVKEPFVPQYMPGTSSRGYRYSVREEKHPPPLDDTSKGMGTEHHLKSPSEEEPTAVSMFTRTRQRVPDNTQYRPFSEQPASIETRQPFLEQLRAIENRIDGDLEANPPSENVSEQNKVKEQISGGVNSSLREQHTNSRHATSSQHCSSSQSTLVTSNQGAADRANLATLLSQQPMEPEDRQITGDPAIPEYYRRGNQGSGYQMPQQHRQLPLGAESTMFHSVGNKVRNPNPWASVPVLYPGYGFQGFLNEPYQTQWASPQPMDYGLPPNIAYPPLSAGPPPPYRGPFDPGVYSGYGQPGIARGLDLGPPRSRPYTTLASRPPSSNRVAAQVYRNDPAFQNNGLAQVRGTPPAASENRLTPSGLVHNHHEWQNRLGLVPAVRPDIPVLPYRPGSDDMRPHATAGVHSVAYQNLTRRAIPAFDQARAPENLPFAETARDWKPPGWGVLKIGNVSTEPQCRNPTGQVLRKLG